MRLLLLSSLSSLLLLSLASGASPVLVQTDLVSGRIQFALALLWFFGVFSPVCCFLIAFVSAPVALC
jgi:hypothetical protein